MKDIKRLPESELEIMKIIWKETSPVSRSVIEHSLRRDTSAGPNNDPDIADASV